MGNIIFALRDYNLVMDTRCMIKLRVTRANVRLSELRARKEFLEYSKGTISPRGLRQGLDQKKTHTEFRFVLSIILYVLRISLKSPLEQGNGSITLAMW